MKHSDAGTLIGAIVALAGSGCSTQMKYPPYGTWDKSVEPLGKVVASRGGWWTKDDPQDTGWSLALTTPPEAYTYHAALLDKAVMNFQVPREEVVLGEVTVDLLTEVVGTVRAWKASALAGRRRPPAAPGANAPSQPTPGTATTPAASRPPQK